MKFELSVRFCVNPISGGDFHILEGGGGKQPHQKKGQPILKTLFPSMDHRRDLTSGQARDATCGWSLQYVKMLSVTQPLMDSLDSSFIP